MTIQGQSQRVNATTQTTTYGPFGFDRIDVGGTNYDFAISKLAFGALSSITYVSSADPLPVTISGVATAALQTTGNAILTTIDADTGNIATSAASIDGKTPALGQALAAGSVPVVLTAAQLSTLTPPAAITGFATESTLGTLSAKFASGTVIGDVNLGATDNAVLDAIAASVASTDGKITACNTGAVVVSSSALPSGAATAAKQPALGTAGTAATDVITVQGIASMTALKVDGSAVTQPISGSVTANIGTVGTLATAAKQDTGNTSLATLAGAVSGTEMQVDIVTMPSVTISGTVTVGSHAVTNAGTFAVQVDGAALTSLQLLDDSVATVGSAITSKGFAAIGTDGTNARILKTDSSGELQVDVLSCASHPVTNAGTFAVQENGAALTSLQLIDDSISSGYLANDINKYVVVGAQDRDNTGKVMPLLVNAGGKLYVEAEIPSSVFVQGSTFHDDITTGWVVVVGGRASAAAPTNVSADGDTVHTWHLLNGSQVCNLAVGGTLVTGSAGLPVAQQGTWTVGLSAAQTLATVTTVTTVSTLTGGGVAHDGTDSGNPVKVGAKALTSLATTTLVANGDRTDATSDLDGAIIVRHGAPLGDNKSTSQSVTNTTSTAATNFGAVASTKNIITEVTVFNSSATDTFVKLQDGSGGTTFWVVPAPAGSGAVIQFARGLKQPTANTALYFAANASASTIYVSINGYQSKV